MRELLSPQLAPNGPQAAIPTLCAVNFFMCYNVTHLDGTLRPLRDLQMFLPLGLALKCSSASRPRS